MPTPEAPLTQQEAERLLYHEARLLDERRFEEWLDLFARDCRYVLPGGQADPPLLDDDRATLEDRVERLRSPAAHAQSPPSRTIHVVANVEAVGECIHSTLVVHEARAGQARAFAARCVHVLRREDDRWRIAEKRVRLVDADHPLYNLTFLC